MILCRSKVIFLARFFTTVHVAYMIANKVPRNLFCLKLFFEALAGASAIIERLFIFLHSLPPICYLMFNTGLLLAVSSSPRP